MTWRLVFTNAGTEWSAHRWIQRQGYESLCLHYWDTIRHARQETPVRRALYPRYLFARAPVYDLNRTIGVSTTLYHGAEPIAVPETVIAEQRARGDSEGLVALTLTQKQERRRYHRGVKIKITAGPFSGLMGMISLDSGHEIRVWLDEFRARGETIFRPESVSPVVAER
jgi:transcription antitermination factor NusG